MNKNFLENGFYNTVGGIIRIGLMILTIPLLIRLIGVEEYGLWTLASSVIAIVGLAEAGLATATTVFVSQDLGKKDIDGLSQTLTVTVGAMLILATIAAIALWFGAEGIISIFTKLDNTQQLTGVEALQIGGLVVWARLLQQILVGVEQAYQRYGLMNLLNTSQSALITLGMLVIAYRGGRTIELMQWQAVAAVAVLLSHAWAVRSLLKTVNLRLAWSKDKGLAVGRYSVMIWLSSLGGALFARGDRLIVGSLLGTQSLGVYAVITDITTQINSLSSLPIQPLLPSLSKLTTNEDINQPKLQEQVKQAFQINSFIALVIGGGLLTFAHEILNLVVTAPSSKEEYIVSFSIVVIIYSIYSINAVGYYVLLALNAANKCMVIQVISGVLSLLLITIGLSRFGLVGASLGNSGYFLTLLLNVLAMKQLSIPFKQWIKYLQWPLLWFMLVIVINLNLPHQMSIKVLTFVVQTVVLTVWFISSQRIKLISVGFF